MDEAARKELQAALGQKFLDLGTRHPSLIVHLALADALATSVGGVFSLNGKTIVEACDYLEGICKCMMAHVIENWGTIQRGDH